MFWKNQKNKSSERNREQSKEAWLTLKELAYGKLIDWENNFKKLERFSRKSPDGYDKKTYEFAVGDAVLECASFQSEHTRVDQELAAVLQPIEDVLATEIMKRAKQCGFVRGDLADAICCIANHGQLKTIINKINELEADLA